MRAAAMLLFFTFVALPLRAQSLTMSDVTLPPPPLRTATMSGPRFGATVLSPGVVDKLHQESIEVGWSITQFGWQLEKQFYGRNGGVAAVQEWVLLLGGLEQGVALPSLNWMVGLRSRTGMEFAVGPNVTPAGVALALAGGVTFRSGALNVPVTFAVVPSKVGTRVSLLTGFNMRGR